MLHITSKQLFGRLKQIVWRNFRNNFASDEDNVMPPLIDTQIHA